MSKFVSGESHKKNKSSADNTQEKNKYYEKIWLNHCKGVLRDHVATGSVRDLVDFFVLPSITTKDGKDISSPFNKPRFSSFIVAGSGFGKTTLLHIMLLCSLIDKSIVKDCSQIKDSINGKEDKYACIRKSLFGDSETAFFPVFVDSKKANTDPYTSILDLAEENSCDCFFELIKAANDDGNLLLLIDSIDEVESDKFISYLSSIKALLSEYKNASVVLTSRFSRNTDLPFKYNLFHLKELNESDIEHITFAILSNTKAEEFMDMYHSNEFIRSLAKNPFALMTFLENKKEYILHHMIESMVNAIIELRWNRQSPVITTENIKLLLGFLACSFVFGNKTKANISEIRNIFSSINENFKINGVPYDIPKDNVDYFLKTLSSQSGILNIEINEHIEEYIFQDDLVACWLAANYIANIINESTEISERNGIHGIWNNMCLLDSFVRSFESKTTTLTKLGVFTIVMALVKCSEIRGQDIQKTLLFYLICRDATSLNQTEQDNIAAGYKVLINNEFGVNDLTNLGDSESMLIINRMLGNHP